MEDMWNIVGKVIPKGETARERQESIDCIVDAIHDFKCAIDDIDDSGTDEVSFSFFNMADMDFPENLSDALADFVTDGNIYVIHCDDFSHFCLHFDPSQKAFVYIPADVFYYYPGLTDPEKFAKSLPSVVRDAMRKSAS